MLLQLKEKNRISYEQPITDFYNQQTPPAFNMHNPYFDGQPPLSPLDSVNFHSLAAHISGVPREAPGGGATPLNEDEIFEILSNYSLQFPPFTQPHYSNFGISLMGRAMARAVNTSYEKYVTDELFTPLGMHSSGFDSNSSTVIDNMAIGFTISNNQPVEYPDYYKPFGWTAPAGGAYSTTSDMTKFLKFLFKSTNHSQPNQPQESKIVSSDAIHQYMLPGLNMADGISSFGSYTFEQVYANGYNTQTKGGLAYGFGSTVAFVPELKLGVFAAINMNTGGIDQVSTYAINQLVPALLADLEQTKTKFALPPDYENYIGQYTANGAIYFDLDTSIYTKPRGILAGAVIGGNGLQAIYAIWDPVQSTLGSDGNYTRLAFRFTYWYPYSCLSLNSVSSGALAYIDVPTSGNPPTVSAPDIPFYNIPLFSRKS